MAKKSKRVMRIGLKDVRALEPGWIVWESALPGFHARRQRSNVVTFVLFYRTVAGKQRFHKIGRHGDTWTPDKARKQARKLLNEVAAGHDPAESREAKKAGTVAELCDQYLKDAEARRLNLRHQKKASTLAIDRGRIERHIKPLLGRKPVASVTVKDIERFMHDVADGKTKGMVRTERGRAIVTGGMGTASRTVGFLGAIFGYAVHEGMRPDNPVRGVKRPPDGQRDRRLSDPEYAQLGKALRTSEAWPPAVAATKFLALTGWRSGEATGLKWSEVDLERRTCRLDDTKTGQSMRPLSQEACAVLAEMKTAGMSDKLVFPPSRGKPLKLASSSHWKSFRMPEDVTPHVLRHSFASLAGDLGFSEPTIAALIGHKGQTMTSRYIHSADAVLLAAADRVAGETLKRMGETY